MGRPKAGVTFYDRVLAQTSFNQETGCFEWGGHKDECGYGRIRRHGRLVRIHRELWADLNGPIPQKHYICHRCDNPGCINPDHLFLGTHTDNMRDMFAKGRRRIVRGSQQGCSKLTEIDIPQIRKLLARKATCAFIAKKYGVSEAAIRNIKKNRAWTHVNA